MNKIYQRIDWENYPSSATPLNEDNLNKMDYAIDKLDDRIVTHETTKLDTATGNSLVKDVTFDEATGIFTIEKLSGSKITINTALEKISTNFHFNPTTQKLVLTLIDGTVQEIDLSALITQYEFIESDAITFEIDSSGKVKANILNGSITGEKLEPNYLADVTLQANNAKTSADNAKTSEELAYQYAEDARQSASQTQKNDATNITYDNSISGLSAENVKDALDEVSQDVNDCVKKQGDAIIQGDVIATKTSGATISLIDNSVPDNCKLITDWNSALTNGWYMGNNASNAPVGNSWWFGRVIAHNENYVLQEVWAFNYHTSAYEIPKQIRARMGGIWGEWVDDSPKSYVKKQGDAIINGDVIATKTSGEIVSLLNNSVPDVCKLITDWNSATKNGWYMGKDATNAPNFGSWWFANVITHSQDFVIQEAWAFNYNTSAYEIPKQIRARMGGIWGEWVDDSPKSYVRKASILLTVADCDASTNDEDVAGASALSELNYNILGFADYKNITQITIEHDTDTILTAPYDCYVYGSMDSRSVASTNFYRITIYNDNDEAIFTNQQHQVSSGTYQYLSSPLLPVRKDTKIKVLMKNSTSGYSSVSFIPIIK